METPRIDEMIKILEWQVNVSRFSTQRNIDLLEELKALKQGQSLPIDNYDENSKIDRDYFRRAHEVHMDNVKIKDL